MSGVFETLLAASESDLSNVPIPLRDLFALYNLHA